MDPHSQGGEQRQREAGKGRGCGGPVPVTPTAGQDHRGTAKPSSSRTAAGMVCWDTGRPTLTAAVPPRAAQTEHLSLPSPNSAATMTLALGSGLSSSQAVEKHPDTEMETQPDGH